MRKNLLMGISLCAVVLFVLSSFNNAVAQQIVRSPVGASDLTVDIITYKLRFPRIYLDSSYFNATIIVTNRGQNPYENLNLQVSFYQAHPRPRQALGYNVHEYNVSFQPGKSYTINFSCLPDMIPRYVIAVFPLEIWVMQKSELVAHALNWYIVYQSLSKK